jgi:ribosomal protein S18 acetylase RimI-like enzyme
MELRFIDPRVDPRYAAEQDLRYRVLRAPLGMGRHEVGFAHEEDALHLVAEEAGHVVGCVLFDLSSGRLRAMAVDEALQRSGLGKKLVQRLEEELERRGIRAVMLHAREGAVGFYERLGYAVRGEPFTEVGLLHRVMTKTW